MPRHVLFILFWLPWAAQAEIRVTDDAGRTVVLAAPARRIVSLTPHLTENLFSAGAGGKLVAVGDFSDYPEGARKLPKVGSASLLDYEALLALKPDLVLAWSGGTAPGTLARLESLGLPIYLSNPRRLSDVATDIERLGMLAGTLEAARAAAASFRATMAGLSGRYSDRPKVRVFYEIWNRPLMTVNGEHLITDAITLCGGENIFARLPRLTPTVTEEAVLAAAPEAIVASGMDVSRPEWLDDWQRWGKLAAVAKNNLFFVPPDLIQRPTARVLDGAAQLCRELETARGRRGK